jgi:formiminotetrahydrofolate cyclodeaminase/Zn-dependent peptidase ImmA (M78 family)
VNLIEIEVGKLLEKFGAGNHKPGSGSASALQSMISAQMLRTVIDLTNEEKRKEKYSAFIPQLLSIKNEIEKRINIRLLKLFQDDSDQFDKVIKIREERDNEQDTLKKWELMLMAREALIPATEIPLEIAELCIELGNFAAYVFDFGFKSARGDSSVALQAAISGVAGCISIANLNLTSLGFDERIEKILRQKTDIIARYEQLVLIGNERFGVLENESNEFKLFEQSVSDFRAGNLADSVRTNSELEDLVRRLQNMLWLQRNKIWKNQVPENPIELLKPGKVLRKVMDYAYVESDQLGIYEYNGDVFEIAGLINKKQKHVQVSNNFSPETKNFTAAHELGHAILHRQIELHRDRPVDGSATVSRNTEEMQADKFATYFLMPRKLVEDAFFLIFQTPRFIINEATVLAMGGGSIKELKQKCNNLRGLSRLLATIEFYDGKPFYSLSKVFRISIETMAIRLEELNLLEY